ncbi:MAG: SDR family oxidoreductase [Ferruginibacter sp.]
MKIVIFGATGMVGKQLVKQSLFKEYSVKAFGRNVFTENLPEDKNLELVQGALFDEGQLLNAIKGCDAILSALGGNADTDDKTRSLGMKKIVGQMEKAGVKRIIAVGGLGVLNATEDKLVMEQENFPPEYIPVSEEHKKALGYLQSSSLDWTFVCPPMIVEGDPTGIFTTQADYLPKPNKFRISTGDLALFMLNELTKNEYLRQRVGISN